MKIVSCHLTNQLTNRCNSLRKQTKRFCNHTQSLVIPKKLSHFVCYPTTLISCPYYSQSICVFVYRLNQRSSIKHSQSGDVSQAAQRPKGRRKLQRGLSEDVPYSTRPQVHQHKENSIINVTLHSTSLCCLHTYYYYLFFFQELVELKQVENISDTEGYPNLEGHCRAASLPRLNAEYYVSSSVSMMPCPFFFTTHRKDLFGSFTVVLFELHSCDDIRFGKCRHCG